MPSRQDELEAWHEAGHAVVARLIGGRVRLVTLEQDEDHLGGLATIEWPRVAPAELASLSARAALGGPLAEIERFGGVESDDARALSAWDLDWAEVERCAASLRSDEAQRRALVQAWADEVRQLVGDPIVEERIARVAEALSAHGTLDEDLFEDCMA